MNLEINLENTHTSLILIDKAKIIDKLEWEEKNNLSRTLLKMIDSMLKKHKLGKKEVVLSVKSALPSGFTSNRIAQSIAKAFDWGIGQSR